MAGISKSAVISLILAYIGGAKLMRVPTVKVGSLPVATQFGGMGSLASYAKSAASAVGGLKAGLSAISKNPLGAAIGALKGKLGGLTSGGFAGLASAIPAVSGNAALATEFTKLKQVLGGADGLSGAVAAVKKFESHTNKLSGIDLSSDSGVA